MENANKCRCVAAVLVWLNYKNAYEYWTEQRLALNREVQAATHQVLQRLPLGGHQSQHAADTAAAPTTTGTLFLRLTVEDLGICVPMNQFSQVCDVSVHLLTGCFRSLQKYVTLLAKS